VCSLESQERSGGQSQERGPIREDWGHNGVEMKFGRKGQKGGKQG